MPSFRIENRHRGRIAGIDEAGRGPWAGPVVAAAAILNPATLPKTLTARLDDSKKLTRGVREALFAEILVHAETGVGVATVVEIDTVNILQATFLAMRRALANLPACPDAAIVDGNCTPDLPCPTHPVIRGDGLSLSIAAASILAKVTRDRMMESLARDHPGYGWERNAGYGTAEHRAAIERLGITPQHRRSFKPIAIYCK